jgi:putative zinc finger/helix-turn-helix YgiT family protein
MNISFTDFCPACAEDRTIRREQRAIDFAVRGETITLELPVRVCTVCETTEIDESVGDPVSLAYATYRELHGLLSPDQVKVIRQRYQLSQRSFATLLGMSEATINRYETGGLQDTAHDTAIRACEDPAFLKRILALRGNGLSEWQRRRVETALSGSTQ